MAEGVHEVVTRNKLFIIYSLGSKPSPTIMGLVLENALALHFIAKSTSHA